MIDIGVNLTNSQFQKDLDKVIQESFSSGIEAMVLTGTDLESSIECQRLCESYSEQYANKIFCTAGIHPHDASTWNKDLAKQLSDLLDSVHCVATGETGLDFNRNFSTKEEQLAAFEGQIELAIEASKPLFLHERDAFDVQIDMNNRIVPRMIDPENYGNEKLKVVFLPSKPQCNVHLEKLATTCLALEDLTEIKTMIKPHTRAGIAANIYQGLQIPIVSHMLTAELCDWADIILVIGSSVISEAIVRGKPALYLKYLHDNTTLFEEIGSCWTIHDESELKDTLIFLQSNRSEVPYNEANIAQYITEVVKGGKPDRNVLQEYEQFIVKHSKSDATSRGV